MPEFLQILYTETDPAGSTPALQTLRKIYLGYDIMEDPYITHLRADQDEKSQRQLQKLILNQKTWCFGQIKSFFATSVVIYRELGPWAVDFYISQVINKLTRLTALSNSYIEDRLAHSEKTHLCKLFGNISFDPSASGTETGTPIISDKVQQFINAFPRDGSLAGIVFVEQRATVAVLAHLLSIHPQTHSLFRVGTVVGSSQNAHRSSNINDLADPKEQSQTLERFRAGQLDLVIATTVLEEGIDVPACNLVMCFDEPKNLKSFVQRRGRARRKESKLVLMQSAVSDKLIEWQRLESDMKRIYADDMRKLQRLAEVEDFEEHDGRYFEVESTG
jgi:ERCC4-related helicase